MAARGETGRTARLFGPIVLIQVAIMAGANLGVNLGVYGPDVRMVLSIMASACAMLILTIWAAQVVGRERRERDNLTSALEHTTVVVLSLDGVIQHWPKACETFYGWTAAEAVGRQPGDLFSLEPAASRADARTETRRLGKWNGEQQHRTRSGEVRWIASRAVWLQDGETGEGRIVATFTDITALKQVSQALEPAFPR